MYIGPMQQWQTRTWKTRTFTDLLRHSGEVVYEVEHGQDLVLRRRDGADLVLLEASNEVSMRGALRTAASLIAQITSTGIDPILLERTRAALPWTAWLPEADQLSFLQEFGQTAQAAAETGYFEPLSRLGEDWLWTARLSADPETRARLQAPIAGEDESVPLS